MALAARDTISDLAPLDSLHDAVARIRPAVEGLVFTATPSSLGSVTQLLSVVPIDLCDQLCAAAAQLPPADIRQAFDTEDRLLIDMVLALYDDLRTDRAG